MLSVETFSLKTAKLFYGDMECLRDDNGKSLIPIGEKLPNGLTHNQRSNLHHELQRLINALNISTGELNIELLIDKHDRPHFLELGPRAGGNMIPIQLSDAFGIDLITANINAAMGNTCDFTSVETQDCFMTFVLHSHNNGIFQDVIYSSEIEPYIYRKVIYKHPGDNVEIFDGAGKALGIIFLRFPNKEIMDQSEENIDKMIKIIIT